MAGPLIDSRLAPVARFRKTLPMLPAFVPLLAAPLSASSPANDPNEPGGDPAPRLAAPAAPGGEPALRPELETMGAGLLAHWRQPIVSGENALRAFTFSSPTLVLQEAPTEEEIASGGWNRGMTTWSWIATGALGAIYVGAISTGDSDDIESVGDVLQYAAPLAGFGLTFVHHDSEGTWQFLKGGAGSFLTVNLFKAIFEKARPNDVGTSSFPSGHGASTFFPAAFVQRRYGSVYGVPFYLSAVYTAYSRVQADKHHLDDVMVGASISILWAQGFTPSRACRRRPSSWRTGSGSA